MSLRQMLRCWLAWLRCERGPAHPLPVVLALPAPEPCTAAVWWLALRERVTGVRLT